MNATLQPAPQGPKSPAHLQAIEAFERVQQALHDADKQFLPAFNDTTALEAQLPGDGAHPMEVLIRARENLVAAQRLVENALKYGLDFPLINPPRDQRLYGEAMGQLAAQRAVLR